MPLDVKVELERLSKMYADSGTSNFNALVYGPMGSGKTNLVKTARKPVYVMCFDPGGSKTIQDEVGKTIFVDTSFEKEDPFNPTVFKAWDEEYHRLKQGNFFASMGTLVIDSATTWSAAAMNVILKKAGRAGSQPFQQDYLPAMVMLENAIKDMMNLPCDLILLAHDTADKDEATGKLFVTPDFIGKLKVRIPLLFDEIYYAHTKETSNGVSYQLLTRNNGLFKARTRIGRNNKFDTYEAQDIKALLRKAGYNTDDKTI